MTPLSQLDPTFVRYQPNGFHYVKTIEEADGVLFLCPGCYRKNGDSDIGVHSVLVWFAGRGVPAEVEPIPRWHASGTSLADLSLSPSINLATSEASKDEWHGYITNGQAT